MESNDGKFFQEKKSIRPTFSAERIHGGTLLAMCSNDFICFYDWAECRLIRRIDVTVKVRPDVSPILWVFYHVPCVIVNAWSWIYQNLFWADSGDLVAIASDTSFYILKYNVRLLIRLSSGISWIVCTFTCCLHIAYIYFKWCLFNFAAWDSFILFR